MTWRDGLRPSLIWVAVALRATDFIQPGHSIHRRTECDGYPRGMSARNEAALSFSTHQTKNPLAK